jgi:hypothetical protein
MPSPRRLHLLPLGATTLVVALGSVGCESVLGAEFGEAEPFPACDPARPPDAPDVSDPDTALPPLEFVISELELGDERYADGSSGLDHVGLDLDGSCTGPTVAPTCLPPEWAGGDPVDGPRGQDNGLSRLLFANSVSDDVFRSSVINAQVAEGNAAPNALLRVSGYEGLDNDPEVEVELFVAAGPASKDEPLAAPQFDGNDEFPVTADSVDDPSADRPTSRYRSSRAYVRDFVLVAEFDRAALSLANVVMTVNDAVVMGRIASTAPNRALTRGTVAGWVDTGEMLAAISETAYQLYGVRVCMDSPTYQQSKELACRHADLERDDIPSVGEGRCNALGFGYGFEAVAATIGGAVERPPAQKCPESTDPAGDSCAEP